MKLSLNWINDYTDLSNISTGELVNRLTLSTCEVDGVEETFAHLDQIVAARILDIKKHPDADKLSICTVDAGTLGVLKIVTGAKNVKAMTVVALAPIGAKIPKPDGESLEIKQAKLRGEDSYGMLCSAGELGLEKILGEHDGIMILEDPGTEPMEEAIHKSPNSVKPGTRLSELFPVHDTVLDIDNKSITHRPDLWCHFGFAREIAAVFRLKINYDPLEKVKLKEHKNLPEKEIVIEEGAAKAYFGLHVTGTRVEETPLWMKARLAAIGQKSINNIVDVSNYVMFELGQPNHAFDARTLKTGTITVARNGLHKKIQQFTTLDEETRPLPKDSIMILDGDAKTGEMVALGGIMGGLHSSIAPDTTDLFLESATFPRERIRRTISSMQLRTDSSQRFEKGQDPLKAKPALARMVELLQETCPHLKAGVVTGSEPEGPVQNKIEITLEYLRERLGFRIKEKEVEDILGRLHFDVKSGENKKGEIRFKLKAPTFRSQYDITIPEDIVEELGRIYGYDNIEPSPSLAPVISLNVNLERVLERNLKNFFIHNGHYHETHNYSFARPDDNEIFGMTGLKILNPIMKDMDRMRLSQIPGIIRQAAGNQDRFSDVRLLELGRIYVKDPGLKKNEIAVEQKHATMIHVPPFVREKGIHQDESYLFKAFLNLRELIEEYLRETAGAFHIRFIEDAGKKPEVDAGKRESVYDALRSTPYLHPGCAVKFVSDASEKIIAVAGILHPSFEKRYDLKRGAIVAQIYVDDIFPLFDVHRKRTDYAPPSVFPDSTFELSLVMNSDDSTAAPVDIIRSLNIPELRKVDLLTVYRGEPLPEEKKSASFEVTCGRNNGTLSGDELQTIMDRMIEALAEKGFPLR